jgi:hypothetical protein
VLAQWVSTVLEKALTERNIKSGLRSTGIFPFNPRAMEGKIGPSDFYNYVPGTAGDMMEDPIAVDLAAPIAVQLGSLHASTEALDSDCEEEAEGQQGRVAGAQGDPCSDEEYCESEVEEEYLADLEAVLAETEAEQQ